jgi:membrane protease YdiL (CAAX protease family)
MSYQVRAVSGDVEPGVFAATDARSVILLTVGGFVLPAVVGSYIWPRWLDSEEPSVEGAICGLVSYVLIALSLWVLYLRPADNARVLGAMPSRREAARYASLGVPMVGVSLAGLYLLFLPVSYVVPALVKLWLLEAPPTLFWRGGFDMLVGNSTTVVTAVVLAPVVEEVVFRGFLLNRWRAKYGPRIGIGLSALCFAVLHAEILGAVVFSVVLSLVYLRTSRWRALSLCT